MPAERSGWPAFGTPRVMVHRLYTFLTFLIVLIIDGALALIAIRTYPRDVATAAESYRRQPITEAS